MKRAVNIGPLLSLLIICLWDICTYSPLRAQTYKAYITLPSQSPLDRFTVNEVKAVNGGRELMLTGDCDVGTAQDHRYGYMIHLDEDGQTQREWGIRGTLPTLPNEIRSGGIAIDKSQRYYWAGTHIQNQSGGAEKVLASYEPGGKLRWARMFNTSNYADIIYDMHDRSVVTIGGPASLSRPNRPLTINKLDEEGNTLISNHLEATTGSEAIEIVDLPYGEGYIVAARTDTQHLPHPWITHLDQNLEIVWSYRFPHPTDSLILNDLSYHPTGMIVAAGTAFDQTRQQRVAFVLRLEKTGAFMGLTYLVADGGFEMEAKAITAFDDGTVGKSGLLLAGSYYPKQTPTEKRSFVAYLNNQNEVEWSKDFTATNRRDLWLSEEATSLTYFTNRGTFGVGATSLTYFGSQVVQRRIWVSKALTINGQVTSDAPTCTQDISLRLWDSSINMVKDGITYRIGNPGGYTFQTDPLDFVSNYCGFSMGPNQITHIDPTTRQRGSYQLVNIQGQQVLRWEGRSEQWQDLASQVHLAAGWYVLQAISNPLSPPQKVWVR